ncbi:MAG: tandem-95 repeat protein, partial [Desulfuromonadales bacterium]
MADENTVDEETVENKGNPEESGVNRTLPSPTPGQTDTVPMQANQIVEVPFDLTDQTITVTGNDLSIEFADGAVLILEDFAALSEAGQAPFLVMEDGSMVPGDILLAALTEPPEETAAGETGAQSGGSSAYVDDMGDTLTGIDKLGVQDPDAFGGAAPQVQEDEQTPVDEQAPNLAPDAVDDNYVIPIDPKNPTAAIDAIRGILSNDTDPEGEAIQITNVSVLPPSVTVNSSDGSLTIENLIEAYRSLGDGEESDPITFQYTISDPEGLTDTANVSIVFIGVNDLADGDESVTTPEDTPVSGNVLDNVDDPDGEPTSVVDFTVDGTNYDAGDTATISGVGTLVINSNGTFTFTPADNYDGPVPDATYTVTDGLDTVTSTLNISITPANDLPDAVNDTYQTDEDTPLTITSPGVLSNDDIGGDGGTLEVVSNTNPSNGTLSLNADGTFTYTPNADYNGPDSFTYTIRDANGDEDTATVNITVNPVNDLPNSIAIADGQPNPQTEAAEATITFDVTLSNAADQVVTVDFTTVDGTAVAGEDYALNSGTLTFAPGETTQTVTVTVLDDSIYENPEAFSVLISNAQYGGSDPVTISDDTGAGLILDNDAPPPPTTPQVSIAVAADDAAGVVEGGVVNFVVTQDALSDADTTVTVRLANGSAEAGSDYTDG